jgi:hypothetical protein
MVFYFLRSPSSYAHIPSPYAPLVLLQLTQTLAILKFI